MEKNNKQQQFEDLGEIELNTNGRPKQALILYELTSEMIESAKSKIQKDNVYLPQKKYDQAKEKCAKVWDNFYSNHKCNFFKDRNYLERQIKQIAYFREKHEKDKQIYNYMEMGCGVGNTLFPLLRQYSFFNFQGCDISAQAIKLIEKQMENHPVYKQRLQVKVCDLVKDQLPFQDQKPDLLSMIFVLSAIVPQKHQQVINKIAKWMKPGSCFFFRDYGRYDFGQVNMSNKGSRKLKDNFYVKHDGVCVYYFQQSQLEQLFQNAGLIKAEGSIHCRLLQNRKTGLKMYRIWVQGRFYKPPIDPFFEQKIKMQKVEKQQQKKVQKVENEENIQKSAQKFEQKQQNRVEKKQNEVQQDKKCQQNESKLEAKEAPQEVLNSQQKNYQPSKKRQNKE